jgi:hypothetical protein
VSVVGDLAHDDAIDDRRIDWRRCGRSRDAAEARGQQRAAQRCGTLQQPRRFNRGVCSSLSIYCKPAFTTQASRRSTPARSERTGEAGAEVAVAVEVFRVIGAAMDFGEFCARRAGVVVVLSVVEEATSLSSRSARSSAAR